MTISINPGTGPVADAHEALAWICIGAFVSDLLARDLVVEQVTRGGIARDGRYPFTLRFVDGREVEIDMPGLHPEKVRFVGDDGQNPWDFPRLYVDGSSWLWKYALNACEPEDNDQ